MRIEDEIKRRMDAARKVEEMSGPAMMKVVRETQAQLKRGEEVLPSALKMVKLFDDQVEKEANRSAAQDLLDGLKVSIPIFLIGAVLFTLAVYGAVRLLHWVGAL